MKYSRTEAEISTIRVTYTIIKSVEDKTRIKIKIVSFYFGKLINWTGIDCTYRDRHASFLPVVVFM